MTTKYTVTVTRSSGRSEQLGADLTERSAVAVVKRVGSGSDGRNTFAIVGTNGASYRSNGKRLVDASAARQDSPAITEARIRELQASQVAVHAAPVRETREQRAAWLEDVEGNYAAAERIRRGSSIRD